MERTKLLNLRNGSKGDSNTGSLDCESGIILRFTGNYEGSIHGCRNDVGYLTIIELTIWPCVWKSTPITADVTVVVSRPHSHESVIFSYFWHSYFYATATLLNI